MSIQLYDLIALSVLLFGGAFALLLCRGVYMCWKDRQRLAELARRDRVRQEHPELGRGDASDY